MEGEKDDKEPLKVCCDVPVEYFMHDVGNRPLILDEKCRCSNCQIHKRKKRKIPEDVIDKIVSGKSSDVSVVDCMKNWKPRNCCCGCTGKCCSAEAQKEKDNDQEFVLNSDESSDEDSDEEDMYPLNICTRKQYNDWVNSLESVPGYKCCWPRPCLAHCYHHPLNLASVKPHNRGRGTLARARTSSFLHIE